MAKLSKTVIEKSRKWEFRQSLREKMQLLSISCQKKKKTVNVINRSRKTEFHQSVVENSLIGRLKKIASFVKRSRYKTANLIRNLREKNHEFQQSIPKKMIKNFINRSRGKKIANLVNRSRKKITNLVI